MLAKAAGMRPDPAVSVPSESGTSPAPTAKAEPVLEPPGELRVEQIAPDAVGRADADEAGGKLIEVGLTDNERAGFAQPSDADGVFVWTIAKGRTGRRGRQAFHIDIVFDGDRDAVKRQRCLVGLAQSARLGEELRLVSKRDENRRVVVGADACVAPRDDVRRTGGATAVSFEDFGDRLRHRRLRVSREKRARKPPSPALLCQIRGISQWAWLPAARGRPRARWL